VLAEAVARFQRRHGIAPSGELDPRTVRALDVPLARRAEQLALALERWRSLPRRAGAPPVVVTLPELRVRVPGATPPLSLRAAAGAACERLTSTFAGEIGRVVLRPASRSARGVVELVFPNPHAVTLSGTAGDEPPDRARPETARACLHVERADELAAWLLRDEPTKDGAPPWSAERVRRALSGGGRTDVTLTHPAPVLVVHTAAVVSDDGAVLFLEGGARGDAALAEALAREEARRGGR
jgi:murein L,D-transpeptidase YcbB/YkuD